MKATGGYIVHRLPLVRAQMHEHTAQIERPVSEYDIAAVNAVQATAWRINTFVLDVMLEAWLYDLKLPNIEKAQQKPLPPKMPDEVWETLSEEGKKAHKSLLAKLHGENQAAAGRERAMLDYIGVADELRDRPAIYFPHNRCFRGRLHPMTSAGPQPQANDMGKSLLKFAQGLELGPQGYYWLLVRAANCAGQDKLSLDERVGWALDHKAEIVAAAADPLRSGWWSAIDARGRPVMDEPWGLLATCQELAMAWELDDPTTFVSHLPVPLDGTCNGLQHLSAMGLDPVGAKATNLCSTAERNDIYMDVAASVRRLIQEDVLRGSNIAPAWTGKLEGSAGRKVVKQAVMTTPYGVTDRGIREQIMDQGKKGTLEGCAGADAEYLRDKIVEALGESVGAAKAIMAWLQTVAHRLANAGLPFEWETPTGSRVLQAYHHLTEERVNTLCGKLVLQNESREGGINARKQASGAAPNVIHSFDAAHLAMTVNRCHDEGVRSFAMVHDSFATHARNTGTLARVLREAFVDIYKEDWLARIAADLTSRFPHVELPPVPERGGFDVTEVLSAPFFFS